MKHTDIRKAIIDALESHIGKDALYFDGRPAVLEEGDFPAVAVFLTYLSGAWQCARTFSADQ